jgi:hypothetical protein
MDAIKIKCDDVVPLKMKITHANGKEIQGVTALDIRSRPNEVITATLSIMVNEINIKAEPLLSFNTLQEMAKYYGYELVTKGTKY